MPRVKKVAKFDDLLKPMSGDDLRILISEAQSTLKRYEKENSTAKKMEKAVKLRDSLKIGSTVSFMAEGNKVSAPVIGITADKIQVEFNGKKKNLGLLKILAE